MSCRAFLDICIGDVEAYKIALDKYQRAEAFMTAVGAQYGWGGSVLGLDEEQQATLLEAYSADPAWSGRGEAATQCPEDIAAGRIVVELFESECPKTCSNFKALCTGEKGLGKASRKPLHYKGHRFHRIVSDFCCQGGDVARGDGSGGESTYGGTFPDEKKGLGLKHGGAGVLSMANSGRNTNTSQFFLTLAAAPQCDGKHTVFGKVVEGLEILDRINREAASADGTPRVAVTITDCGLC